MEAVSYIAFHTVDRTGYISGAERAHTNLLVKNIAAAYRHRAFEPDQPGQPSLLRKAIAWPTNAFGDPYGFDRDADTHIAVNPDLRAVLPSGPTSETVLNINLNTVIANSEPQMQLVARISGQCEVHGFVEGEDRAWFAEWIIDALISGRLRQDMSWYMPRDGHPNGWKQIAELARADNTSPMVMSYSVMEWFPNPAVAVWPDTWPDEDDDPDGWATADAEWSALTDTEAWDRAVAGLRRIADAAPMLRISPDNLATAGFGHNQALTWLDIAAAWRQHQTTSERG